MRSQSGYFAKLNERGLVTSGHFRLGALRLCRTESEVEWMASEMRKGGTNRPYRTLDPTPSQRCI